jgi:uncharacterized phage protein (TIGR02218 family)
MKPVTPQLTALLASRQFVMARLFTITLADGSTVLRYCGGDRNVTSIDGFTYSAGGEIGPYFDKVGNVARGSWSIGTGSDTIQIDVLPGSATVNGQPFVAAVRYGLFDGADLQMDYAFMNLYGIVQTGCQLIIFKGRVAEVDADRTLVSFHVNDYRELLNQNMPRNLFTASCMNTLYDASCTVDPTDFNEDGSVDTGTTRTLIKVAGAITGTPDDYWNLGKLTFTSGPANGMTVALSQWDPPSSLYPVAPLPVLPDVGDTFTVFAGCDRTLGAGGCIKFNNEANFRGFPFIPTPETAA